MGKLLALPTSRCLMLARCCGMCITVPRRLPDCIFLSDNCYPSCTPQALASLDFHSEKLESRMAELAPFVVGTT